MLLLHVYFFLFFKLNISPVYNPQSRLKIKIVANDKNSTLLGQSFLSLADLSDQAPRTGWYEMIGGSGDNAIDKPIIKINTKYVFSEISDFFTSISNSQFPLEERIEEDHMPEYVAEKLVDNCYRALSHTKLFTALIAFMFLLMNWSYPFLNIVIITLLSLCCFFPFLFSYIFLFAFILHLLVENTNIKFLKVVKNNDLWLQLEKERKLNLAKIIDSLRSQAVHLNDETRGVLCRIQYEAGRIAINLEDFFGVYERYSIRLNLFILFIILISFFVSIYIMLACGILLIFCWNSKIAILIRQFYYDVRLYIKRCEERKKLKFY